MYRVVPKLMELHSHVYDLKRGFYRKYTHSNMSILNKRRLTIEYTAYSRSY